MGYTVILWPFFRVNQRMPSLPDMLQTVLLFHHRIKMSVGQVGIPPFHHKKACHLQRQTASFLYRGVRISMMVF